MKNIKHYTEEQLQRVSDMWSVRSKELQWKANKLKVRLEKRLAREAKRHASIASTRQLLTNSQVILDALLPLGETPALELVRAQIAECEAKINDVMYRYRLLFPEEIALKQMDIELAEMKAALARTAKEEVEAELMSRRELVQEQVIQTTTEQESTPAHLTVVGNDSKMMIELGILRAMRQTPNAFLRLKSHREAIANGKLLQWRKRLPVDRELLRLGRC